MSLSILTALLGLWCTGCLIGSPLTIRGASAGDAQRGAERGAEAANTYENSAQFKSPPMRFEMNVGQSDREVRFLSTTRSGDLFLTPREMVLRVREASGGAGKKTGARLPASEQARALPRSAVVRLQIQNENPDVCIVGLDPLSGTSNYFIGNDPKEWRTNVPSFAKVKYANVYPGIDLIYYGKEGNLEYDFEVAPGADPKQIAMSVEGADGVRIDTGGNLVMSTAIGDIRELAPRIYQQDGAGRREIAGGYVMRRDGRVAFQLASYDASKALVIDPQLEYATYFGGTAETDILAIATDSAGFLYVAGDTYAHDFPTKNPVQSTNRHSQSLSAIVTKFSPDGQSLVYSTYLGGSGSSIDAAVGIAVDGSGAAYVTGTTGSSDFPRKNQIPGVTRGTGGLFATKISAAGSSLVYSSVIGGTGFDNPRGIVLDSSDNAYVFGDTQSSDFPTVNPTQAASGGNGHKDGFFSVVGADGSQLLFSTYLGGSDDDDVRSLTVASQTGDVYLSGETQSPNFAGNDGSLRAYHAHFVRSASTSGDSPNQGVLGLSPLNEEAASFNFNTFYGLYLEGPLGGSFDIVEFFLPPLEISPQASEAKSSASLAEDQQGGDVEVFVSGSCVVAPPNTTCTGTAAVVIADASTLAIKSVINIVDTIPPVTAVVRDLQGAIYVTGTSGSNLTPLVDPIQSSYGGSLDAFVTVFAPSTRQIVFSTYLGGSGHDVPNGIALDPEGNIYIAGQTQSPNFPTLNAYRATPPAPNGVSIGQGNSFIAKISALNAAPGREHIVKSKGHSPERVVPPRPGH